MKMSKLLLFIVTTTSIAYLCFGLGYEPACKQGHDDDWLYQPWGVAANIAAGDYKGQIMAVTAMDRRIVTCPECSTEANPCQWFEKSGELSKTLITDFTDQYDSWEYQGPESSVLKSWSLTYDASIAGYEAIQ